MKNNNTKLAIIIPAYKTKYLSSTLESIEKQSDKRYKIYIGDDASPEPIFNIIKESPLKDKIIYKKWEKNLGKESLVKHWHRCINLTKEPWIWLFSDDDLMDFNCVSNFYGALGRTNEQFDIYRFNTLIIGDKHNIIDLRPPHPKWESWYNFTYFTLSNLRQGNQQELIFRRSRYDAIGGFPEFPLAWWSDIAFTIICALKTGIWTINGSFIKMRMSNLNISSIRAKNVYHRKFIALIQFTEWLFKIMQNNDCGRFPGRKNLEHLAIRYFFNKLRKRHEILSLKDIDLLTPLLVNRFKMEKFEIFARLFYFNLLFVIEFLKNSVLHKLRKTFPDKFSGL